LQAEAFDIYLPSVDTDFDAEKLLSALKIRREGSETTRQQSKEVVK